jgi:hypothetical protein
MADLKLAQADSDSYADLCQAAEAGLFFYGYATRSRYGGPVVFASDGRQCIEAQAGEDPFPTARLLDNGFPDSSELTRGRAYYRCLAVAVAALPEEAPCVPTLPAELAARMGCECGGRGWYLAEDEDLDRFVVVRCETCGLYASDRMAGLFANTSIEAGWP